MTRPTIGLFLTLVLSLLVAPLAADAQQPTKVPRIGFLSGRGAPQTSPNLTLLVNALLHRLRSGLNQDLAQAEQSVPPSCLVHRSSCP
jgi:hypothetical protein